ncbi:GNAT family N-acetyltransferase [Paraburkholderia kururiensis]|uniref:GNAT family N-acetyltransferase n=1 Tax=Paraburkholderia kururiensis TaxID=984307 RepID=A0ABZ0WT20_9BURK|nr:GNAT family N-acetyltransferase [Paraburkholderia kururiensis]WQD80403.1 GNAT family N-acetyltransferase [Paraburkholderia kururiensis]
MDAFQWRRYARRDAPALAALFREAVMATAHYDLRARTAWAHAAADLDAFCRLLAPGLTLVAVAQRRHSEAARGEEEVAAFAQLHPADHVEMLYTAPRWAGRGLAASLLARLEAAAREAGAVVLTADASAAARSVFERAGFGCAGDEVVWREGVSLRRFRMCKPLNATQDFR